MEKTMMITTLSLILASVFSLTSIMTKSFNNFMRDDIDKTDIVKEITKVDRINKVNTYTYSVILKNDNVVF